MQIQTPAKINTLLHILKKRTDGYHELYMHMVPISLFDTIRITPNQKDGIVLRTENTDCGSTDDNLVVKAAKLFATQSGIEVHLDFHLTKRIPVGAGLGGGSGNAAGVLQALNHLYHAPFTMMQLHQMASSLGSDIPFFLEPTPCEVKGRGEQLHPLSHYPSGFVVVVKPSFSISTSEAYSHCRPVPMTETPDPMTDLKQLSSRLFNQFEASLLPAYPVLSKIKQQLCQLGALGALVTGSGSAVFGLFSEKTIQQQAALNLSQTLFNKAPIPAEPNPMSIGVFCCEILHQHSYGLNLSNARSH